MTKKKTSTAKNTDPCGRWYILLYLEN